MPLNARAVAGVKLLSGLHLDLGRCTRMKAKRHAELLAHGPEGIVGRLIDVRYVA